MTNLIIERKTIGELGRHVEVLGLMLLAYLIRITILSTRFLVKKTTYQVWKKSTLRSWSHTALSFFSSIPIPSEHRSEEEEADPIARAAAVEIHTIVPPLLHDLKRMPADQ